MIQPGRHLTHVALLLTPRPRARAEFGIGMRSYGIGPNFRGVKMIPPGLHLVTYGTGMERVGVFLQFGAGAQHSRKSLASAARAATRRTRGPPACSGPSL